MKNKHQLLALIILATLLTPIVQCSSLTFTIDTASETSGSLPIDGDATIPEAQERVEQATEQMKQLLQQQTQHKQEQTQHE